MFDSEYELLKARVLGGFQRNSRKAASVSEGTKMFQTTCDKLTTRLKIQEPEGSETHPQGEDEEDDDEVPAV